MDDEASPVLDELDDLAEDFKALANSRRLHLLHLLTKPRYGEELSEALDTTRPNALKHVDKLEDRGFVRSMHGRRESGPVVEYQVVPQRLYALSVALEDLGRLEPRGGPEISRSSPTLDDELPTRGGDDGDRQAADQARLCVLDGPKEGSALELDPEASRWRIGRDEEGDLVLDHDPYVSNRHAEIHVVPAGHAIVDADSSNGTFLNFDRLPPGDRVTLRSGDILRIGHTRLVYQIGER